MRALTVEIQASAGRVLCCSIFRPGGRKLLGKGHLLSADDVRLLKTEGMNDVWVTELEEGVLWLCGDPCGCGWPGKPHCDGRLLRARRRRIAEADQLHERCGDRVGFEL